MRKCIAVLGSGVLCTFCAASFGGLSVTSHPALPAGAQPWPVSNFYGATPRQKTIVNVNDGTVNETVATNRAAGAEFRIVPGREFTLGSVAINVTGAAHTAADMSIHLYRTDKPNAYQPPPSFIGPNPQIDDPVTPAPAVEGANATYTLSTDAQDINAAGTGDNDLLGGGAGLTFTYGGGASNHVLEFVLSGTDQVNLTAGVYVFELWNTGADTIFWRRYASTSNGLVTAFDQTDAAIPGSFGNRYFQTAQDPAAVTQGSAITRGQIIGDGRRVSLGLYAIPEPASLGLIGLGASALVLRRRRA